MQALRRFGILNDEVSDDLDEAVAWIRDHGLGHIELRSLWGTNVVNLTPTQEDRLVALLQRKKLRVSALATPIFKCALDPQNPPETTGDRFGSDERPVADHYQWLTRALTLAQKLGASKLRIFSFWREADPSAHRAAIAAHLLRASRIAQAAGVTLVLENEPTCNGGSSDEVAALAATVDSEALGVLWDPGNDAYGGFRVSADQATPAGKTVAHVHLKDVKTQADGTRVIVPLGQGEVPWPAILTALDQAGYAGHLTLEPHVRGWDRIEACVFGLHALLASQRTVG